MEHVCIYVNERLAKFEPNWQRNRRERAPRAFEVGWGGFWRGFPVMEGRRHVTRAIDVRLC